jgi:hypothetical protein
MDALNSQLEADRKLREELKVNSAFLQNASDRKHATGLASWYGEFTSKQRGLAKVLLKRAKDAKAGGRGVASLEGESFWGEAQRPVSELSLAVKGLILKGQMLDAIKAHRVDTGASLEEAKRACEAWRLDQDTPQVPGLPQPSAPREATVTGEDLERALAKVIKPATERLEGQLKGATDALAKRHADFTNGAVSVIAQRVLEQALKELEARKPREVRITVEREGVARAVTGTPHPQFEKLLRAATARLADGFAPGILLAGEASSGKTSGARMLAEALGLPWHFNGAISFPHEMLGFIDAGGTYHRTPFREAYEHGGVYTFDEVDRSDPVALLAVNPHLANGVATFPDGQVQRHKDCIIIATANTWGHGADGQYSGATKLDAAFLSRFPVRIGWDIDAKLEEKLVGASPWLQRLRADREKARAAGLKVLIDVRAGLAGAALLAAGYSVQEAAEMTYLAALKPDQRRLLTGD